MVKVKGLSGMWDVAFDPTVKGEVRHIYGHERFWEGDLHGVYRQDARRKEDTWHAIRGPENCKE